MYSACNFQVFQIFKQANKPTWKLLLNVESFKCEVLRKKKKAVLPKTQKKTETYMCNNNVFSVWMGGFLSTQLK